MRIYPKIYLGSYSILCFLSSARNSSSKLIFVWCFSCWVGCLPFACFAKGGIRGCLRHLLQAAKIVAKRKASQDWEGVIVDPTLSRNPQPAKG